jgi:hypothetical protein
MLRWPKITSPRQASVKANLAAPHPESLQTLTDFGLRSLIEHSRHLQAMAEIELERRKSEGQSI